MSSERMTEPPLTEVPGPEEGGGPPLGLPWTLVVDDEDWSADLEHAAPTRVPGRPRRAHRAGRPG